MWDQKNLFDQAESVFGVGAGVLLQWVRQLEATERTGVDTGWGSQLASALEDELPQQALAAYKSNYVGLCAEAPEFAMWAQLREHERTRSEVKRLGDAFDGLHTKLSQISSGRSVGDLRIRLSRKYQALLSKQVLPLDDVLPEDLPPGMVIPALRDCYVPPSARVARIRQGDTPSAKGWWEERELLPDLQGFLAARLTHPDMTRYPTVLLGEPGAGKSKLTEVLAAQLPEEDFLAVRVELRAVSADAAVHTQVEEGLEHELRERVSLTGELLAEADGALPVIILDGFDELLEQQVGKVFGFPQSDELESVLDQLAPYLAPGLVERVLGGLRVSGRTPAATAIPDQTLVSGRHTGDENSVVDIKPMLDLTVIDRWDATPPEPA